MQNCSVTSNILNIDEIHGLLNADDVVKSRELLSTQNVVKFSIPLSPEIKSKIEQGLNIDLSKIDDLPLRWVKGDTSAHIDKGETHFSKTHLIYLTDSGGNLVINGELYEMRAGNAYVFNEGLEHSTVHTEDTVRLMIGPMSETGHPVGSVGVIYLPTDYDGSNIYSLNWMTDLNAVQYYNANPVTIYGIPPLSNDSSEYTTYGTPNWTIPDGFTFGGWKISSVNSSTIDDVAVDHIYTPGETFTAIYYNLNIFLIPVWVPIPKPQKIKQRYSDNSLVFYKRGSLSTSGTAGVSNSRVKSRKT
jgi:hypothetical protein